MDLNITENNISIAEFMGWNISKTRKTARIGKGIKSSAYRIKDLHYDTSWEWLMPVVEKIEHNSFHGISITEEQCEIWDIYDQNVIILEMAATKIECTYNAVVAFIKSPYNSII